MKDRFPHREVGGGLGPRGTKDSNKILLRHALYFAEYEYNVARIALKHYISKYMSSVFRRNEIASYILLETAATRQRCNILRSLLSIPPAG